MKQKIKITTDSSSDFYPLAKEFDVEIVPQVIILGDTEYFDGVDVNADDVYDYVSRTKKLPKTAAISGDYIEKMFKKLSKENDAVIHISIGSALSTSIDIAKKAAANFKNVHVVDSRATSGGQAMIVLKACELVKQGKSVEEIIKALEEASTKIKLSFLLETLEFLHKGGRCSALKYTIANILKIRPRLDLIDGKPVPTKKYKGKYPTVLQKFITEKFEESAEADKDVCIILDGRSPQEGIDKAERQAKEAGFKRVFKISLGANMTCHSGAGTIVIVFLSK